MAWYNPSTWKPVDVLQGQRSWGADPRTSQQVAPASPDPNKVYGTINGRAYNYAGDWLGGGNNNQNAGEIAAAMRDQAAASRAQAAAYQASLAAMPKLPSFDITGSYNRARTQAEANLRPHYDVLWNNFMAEQNIAREKARGTAGLRKEESAMERQYTVEDNATNRQRTGEDVATQLQQIGETETNYQTDEGQQFDEARRGLMEEIAAAGGTDTGLGQQQIGKQQDQRNVASERQVKEFENQRASRTLFKERTFADLARGDLRADEKKVLADKATDFDLDIELKSLAQQETNKRVEWEGDLLSEIISETGRLRQEEVSQFLASLAGGGARSQDIALASDVYGGLVGL